RRPRLALLHPDRPLAPRCRVSDRSSPNRRSVPVLCEYRASLLGNPMPRWLRLSATAAALVLLVPLVCGVAAYAWLQTGMGRQWVAARLHDLSGGQVEIANLGGGLPFRLTADRVAISDANGPWLVAEKVEIAVAGRKLLDRELRIETASAERLRVLRLPGGEPRKPGAPGPALPSLPILIALGQLTVPHLILAAPVLGEPGEFTLNGAGSLDMREASLQLALDRSDGPG